MVVVNRQPGCREGSLRRARTALVVAAAAGLLAGCASAGGGSSAAAGLNGTSSDVLAADPLTAVRTAPDITGHAGSVQDVTTLQTSSGSKKVTLHGTAQYDYVTRLGRMAITVPPGGPTHGQLVEVFSPGVAYMQNSGAKVPAGMWVKVDVQQLADGNLVSSGATDPATAANALRGASTATLVDSQTVDGLLLKHYRGTLDLAKAAAATGGGAGTGLTLAGRTFVVKKIPYDVWLDEHGRIHRISEIFTFSKVAGSTAVKDRVVVTSDSAFSGYGTPVTVALPAAKDVYGSQTAK